MLDIIFSRFFSKVFVKRISLEKYIVESKKLKLEKRNNKCWNTGEENRKEKEKTNR